ncbi:cell division protein FtsK [Microtetraspora sp. AC03309]|uniref:FtsK/SpoIIIE domain-containing protein n=1 Tax=Microtetraspora sp. AC03309 TaxID=2779376 RepID=UPI001E550783|nr:FtsK/SpoIIIE domain-containing protein [Microtetraspora sp. AC03309]MCC5581565.1 cell division protein FtsK [Microtetraspora sp. AC03309]
MLRKLPGTEVQNVVSTTPDTAIVFAPTVVKTPAIVVLVVWLWRLLAGLVKTVVRHPVACGLVGSVSGLWWAWGGRAVLVAAGVVGLAGSVWAGWWPASFVRVVGARLLAWWRWMWVYRRKWRSVVTVAGLGRQIGGRVYLPDLRRVVCDRWADRVTVRMLKGQTDQEWADRLANLAHGFGAASCGVSVPRPGWVVLTLPRRDPLARVVRARAMPMLASVGPVEIGVREDGSPYRLKVHGTHVLIAGATGAGKGSFLWSAIRGLLPAQRAGLVELWALDPKRMELSFGGELFDEYAATPEDCAALLEGAVSVMHERADRYAGVRRDHVPTVHDPFLLVLVDEVAFLTAYQPDRNLKQRIGAALATLTTQGRAVGVGVMAALQDPRKEVMNIRNLFPDRVALRLDEPDQVDMVLGDGARDRGALADQIVRDPDDPSVGAGVAFVRLENAPEPVRVRAAYVSDADIKDMVVYAMGAL